MFPKLYVLLAQSINSLSNCSPFALGLASFILSVPVSHHAIHNGFIIPCLDDIVHCLRVLSATVFNSITIELELFARHSLPLELNTLLFNEKSQFQYLEIQSSY